MIYPGEIDLDNDDNIVMVGSVNSDSLPLLNANQSVLERQQ